MANEDRFDALVIGSGQGGTPLAVALAGSGRRTAIIERGPVGGTCINVGCTPTKAMYASAKIASLARRAREYGVNAEQVRAELKEIRKRKQTIVDNFRDGTQRQLETTERLELIRGEARFTATHTLEVGSRTVTAPWIFINTGGRPAPAMLEGLEHVRVVDSTTIMELDQAPERLVVIGGGYIGLELGQMFARFGSRVTIIQRQDQLLPQEDKDVAGEILRFLREDGIEVLISAEATRATPHPDGGFMLEVETPDGVRRIHGDVALFAAGRVPNTDRLGLDRAGVEVDEKGFVRVDEKLATNVSGIWAIGDVKGGPAFTHISYDDYRVLKTNLIEGGNASTRGRHVPYTVFVDPQLGRVGLTENEAKRRGIAVNVARLEMTHVARAVEAGETRGFIKALVDRSSGKILGCAVLGMEGGELMAMIQVAMMGELHYTRLRDAIFAHPTLAESLNNLFAAVTED